MAQHYRIYEKDEPKVFKSLRKIMEGLMKDLKWGSIADFAIIKTNKLIIMKLSKEYFPKGRAFSIKPITLQSKEWDQRRFGGLDLRKHATLEIHTDSNEHIIAVYYPI